MRLILRLTVKEQAIDPAPDQSQCMENPVNRGKHRLLPRAYRPSRSSAGCSEQPVPVAEGVGSCICLLGFNKRFPRYRYRLESEVAQGGSGVLRRLAGENAQRSGASGGAREARVER